MLFSIFFLFNTTTSAQFNEEINYQGKLLNSASSPIADGTLSIQFSLYTVPSGGSAIWTETQSVAIQSGLFSVMLGSSTPLSGVDFDQTLYLGVNVASDGEMSPRKVLGAVPAAFQAYEADNASTIGGVASSSFVRSDQADTIEATESTTLLTIIQNGAGNIVSLFDGATEVFTVADGGNVGVGTSTPYARLSVAGDLALTGGIYDNNATRGTDGYILQTTGSGVEWVATSTLGIDSNPFGPTINVTELASESFGDFTCNGTTCTLNSNTVADNEIDYSAVTLSDFTDDVGYLQDITGELFYDLSDTPAVYTANRILYQGGGGVTDSADFTFDGTNLNLGASNGIAFGGTRYISVDNTANTIKFGEQTPASTYGNDSLYIGYQAGQNTTGAQYTTAIGAAAGQNPAALGLTAVGAFAAQSVNVGDYDTAIGMSSGNISGSGGNVSIGADVAFAYGSGASNVLIGYGSAYSGGGSNNVFLGANSGPSATGGNNILVGFSAADSLTTGANNIIIGYDVEAPSNTGSNQLNIGNLIFGTGIDGTGTSLSSGNIGIGTSSPAYKLTVDGTFGLPSIATDNATSSQILSVDAAGEVKAIDRDQILGGEPYIIFATGQSNMSREDTYVDGYVTAQNLKVWNNDNVNENGYAAGTEFVRWESYKSDVGNVAVAFASEFAYENPDKTVYLINVSHPGQKIQQWLSTATTSPDMYTRTRNNVSAALAAIGEDSIDTFLWWQGESNRDDLAEDQEYVELFIQMDEEYQAESWYSDSVPQVLFTLRDGDSSGFGADFDNINRQLFEIVALEQDRRKIVRTEDLEFIDTVHLSGESRVLAGKRAYQVFERQYSSAGIASAFGGSKYRPGLAFLDTSTTTFAANTGIFSDGKSYIGLSIDGNATSSLYVNSDGVGIGTETPSGNLHISDSDARLVVGGTLDQQSGSLLLAEITTAGSEVGFEWKYDGLNSTGNKLFLNAYVAGTPTTMMAIDRDSGFVGIGTTTPQGKLDVSGDGNVLSYIRSTDSNAVQLRLQSDGSDKRRIIGLGSDEVIDNQISLETNGTIAFSGANYTSNRWLTISGGTGNVGIGDASPASLFTVGNGDLFQVNSNGDIITQSVGVDALESEDFGSFTCNGTTCTVDTGAIANAQLVNSSVSFGGVSVALGGSDATPAFNLADATGLPLSTGVTGTLGIANGGLGVSYTDPNADRILFWDDSAGTFANLVASTGLTLSGTNLTVRSASETQTGIAERATNAETVTGTDTTRYISPANLTARLAAPGTIGGTTPGAINATTFTGSGLFTLSGSSANIALGSNWLSGDGADEGIYVNSIGTTLAYATTPSAADLVLGASNPSNLLNEMYIRASNGVLGFGNCTSTTCINMSPALEVSSTTVSVLEPLDGTSADFSSTLTMSGSLANIALGSNFLSGDGDDEGVFVSSTGSVGIGTTTPSNRLTIDSGDNNAGLLVVSTDQRAEIEMRDNTTSAPFSVLIAAIGDDLGLRAGGSDRIRVLSTGKVGIGTTTPAATLQVQGVLSNKVLELDATDGDMMFNINTISSNTVLDLYADGGVANAPAISLVTSGDTYFNNGDFGIGTTSPAARLDVATGASGVTPSSLADELLVQSSGNAGITIGSGNTNTGSLFFADAQSSLIGGITFDHSDNSLSFGVNGATRLKILSDGAIGVGDNTPDANFEISANGATGASLFALSSNDGNDGDLLTVLQAGNVGIGTVSPDSLLNIESASAPTLTISNTDASLVDNEVVGRLNFYGNDASSGGTGITGQIESRASDVSSDGRRYTLGFKTWNNGTLTERMTIDEDGFVGIGTTAPNSRLVVQNGANPTRVKVYNSGSSVGSSLLAQNGSTGNGDTDGFYLGYSDHAYLWNYENTDLGFATNNTEMMTLTSSGNFGIGTTTPTEKLTVTGNVSSEDVIGASWSSSNTGLGADFGGLALYNSDTTNNNFATLYFVTNDTAGNKQYSARIQSVFTDHTSGSEDTDLSFSVNRNGTIAEAIRINSLRDVGIGTSTPTNDLSVIGNAGIYDYTNGGRLTIVGPAGGAGGADAALQLTTDPSGVTNDWVIRYDASTADNKLAFRFDNATHVNIAGDSGILTMQTSGANINLNGNYLSGDGSNEGVFVDTNGEVGIGTNNPSARLHLFDNVAAQSFTQTASSFLVQSSDGTDWITAIESQRNNSTNQRLLRLVSDTAANNSNNFEIVNSNGTYFSARNDGNIGIGTSTPGARLVVAENNAGSASPLAIISQAGSGDPTLRFDLAAANKVYQMGIDNSDNDRFKIAYGASGGANLSTSAVFQIDNAGNTLPGATNTHNLGSASFQWGCLYYNSSTIGTCASDERYKTNIEDLDFDGTPMQQLSDLKLRTFEWKENPGSESLGLIAQEVLQTSPDLVVQDEDGYYKVKYGHLQYLNIAAVQQFKGDLDELLTKGTTTATSSFAALFSEDEPSVWQKLSTLAQGFVDGVLTITGVKTDELCVGDVCVTEEEFAEVFGSNARARTTSSNSSGSSSTNTDDTTPSTTTDETTTTSTSSSTATSSASENTDTSATTTDSTSDSETVDAVEEDGVDTEAAADGTDNTSTTDATDTESASETGTETADTTIEESADSSSETTN